MARTGSFGSAQAPVAPAAPSDLSQYAAGAGASGPGPTGEQMQQYADDAAAMAANQAAALDAKNTADALATQQGIAQGTLGYFKNVNGNSVWIPAKPTVAPPPDVMPVPIIPQVTLPKLRLRAA